MFVNNKEPVRPAESQNMKGQDIVDTRYLEVQGTLLNSSGYPYLDISDLQNWGKK